MLLLILLQTLMSSLIHKIEWRYKNKLINTIIKNDGEIFGGAVRDKYLHDTHAQKFYEQLIKDGISYHMKDLYYSDKTYHPELFGRWVNPNDIDACIHVSKLDNLIKIIKRYFGTVIRVFSHDPSQYLENIVLEENEVRHNCYKIYPSIGTDIISILESMTEENINCNKLRDLIALSKTEFEIKLDLMVYIKEKDENYSINFNEVPFNSLDFECNGLIMDKKSIRLCNHLLTIHSINKYDVVEVMELTIKVLNDIKNRRAIYCNEAENVFPLERINKMVLKDWTILELFKKIELIDDDPEYEGHCLMCHDVLPKVMLKFKCCDGRYHPKCMIQALDVGNTAIVATEKCLMCKKDLRNIFRDRAMLDHYIEFAPSFDWWPSSHERDPEPESEVITDFQLEDSEEDIAIIARIDENLAVRDIMALQAALDQRMAIRTARNQADRAAQASREADRAAQAARETAIAAREAEQSAREAEQSAREATLAVRETEQ